MIHMIAAERDGYGRRDATMILLAFRRGLRACEPVDLECSQIDFKAATLHVRRAKEGTESTHLLRGNELRTLRRLQRESPASTLVLVSERASPFATGSFANVAERAGAKAGFDFKAPPHMPRHACGFAPANAGHDTRDLQAYLGHRNIQLWRAIRSSRRTGSRIFDVMPAAPRAPDGLRGAAAPLRVQRPWMPRGGAATPKSQCLTTLCGALWLVFHEQQVRFWYSCRS
jgi:integrase